MQGVNELQASGGVLVLLLVLWTKSKYISSIWHVAGAGAGAGLRPAAISPAISWHQTQQFVGSSI